MTPAAKQRLIWLAAGASLMIAGVVWLASVFQDNLVFFRPPSELAGQPAERLPMRVGGLVQEKSLKQDGLSVEFSLTDGAAEVRVVYQGILPALFREGQGVVAEGKWNGEYFDAHSLLTKHDENYMPPEVANSLKKTGLWKGADKGKAPPDTQTPHRYQPDEKHEPYAR